MTQPDYFSEQVRKRTQKKPRGFATLSPERVKEIASMGGIRRAELDVGHKFTSEEATTAGLATGALQTEKMLRSIEADLAEFDSQEQMEDAARKYITQRERSAARGIGFEITFAEWWSIWKASGQWEARGRSAADSYVMARHGDVGPYKVGNVRIATVSENMLESWVTSPDRFAHRRKTAAAADPSSPT